MKTNKEEVFDSLRQKFKIPADRIKMITRSYKNNPFPFTDVGHVVLVNPPYSFSTMKYDDPRRDELMDYTYFSVMDIIVKLRQDADSQAITIKQLQDQVAELVQLNREIYDRAQSAL